MTPVVEAQRLSRTYGSATQAVHALREVSLRVEPGEFLCISGPSGSGKSTLLHLLGGLDRPSSGSVKVHNACLEALGDDALSRFRRTRLGFVFQFFNLLSNLTALEQVMLPLVLNGTVSATGERKARGLLEVVGLAGRERHLPHELSGGELQRVAVARALIADPLLLLADEPTGNLDSESGSIVLDLLGRLAREGGRAVVMVTHDEKAARLGTRRITMRDGRIVGGGAA